MFDHRLNLRYAIVTAAAVITVAGIGSTATIPPWSLTGYQTQPRRLFAPTPADPAQQLLPLKDIARGAGNASDLAGLPPLFSLTPGADDGVTPQNSYAASSAAGTNASTGSQSATNSGEVPSQSGSSGSTAPGLGAGWSGRRPTGSGGAGYVGNGWSGGGGASSVAGGSNRSNNASSGVNNGGGPGGSSSTPQSRPDPALFSEHTAPAASIGSSNGVRAASGGVGDTMVDNVMNPVPVDASPNPEPGSLLLIGSGLAGLLGVLRRRLV